MQQQNTSQKQQGLIISTGGKKKLSKNQEAFNKLTQRIEKLQKEIEKKQLQFDLALKIYGNQLYPIQLKILEARYKLITVLWIIYTENKLSKADQRTLKIVLQNHLEEYFSQTEVEPDIVLQKIFTQLEGISYDIMIQQETDRRNIEMQEAFEKINVNMAGIDLNDEAAMEEKVAEARKKIEELKEENEAFEKLREAKRKKSAKQVEAEKMQKAVDEMKQKNISTIYKQLAKLFHPDLEQDENKKADKEILMKELVAAYEAKNLHALLTLELKWIHNETDHLDSLTEEKLTIYLQILKEQASNLDYQKNSIYKQPQYAVLSNDFGFAIRRYPVQTMHNEVTSSENTIKEFNRDINYFESPMGLRHVKAMLKEFKKRQNEFEDAFEDDELMRMLFS